MEGPLGTLMADPMVGLTEDLLEIRVLPLRLLFLLREALQRLQPQVVLQPPVLQSPFLR